MGGLGSIVCVAKSKLFSTEMADNKTIYSYFLFFTEIIRQSNTFFIIIVVAIAHSVDGFLQALNSICCG